MRVLPADKARGALFAAPRVMYSANNVVGMEMNLANLEEDRVLAARRDFKSDEACSTRLVGSTPALFRHFSGTAWGSHP